VTGSPIVTSLLLRLVAVCEGFVTLVLVLLHRKLHHGFEMAAVLVPPSEGGMRHDRTR